MPFFRFQLRAPDYFTRLRLLKLIGSTVRSKLDCVIIDGFLEKARDSVSSSVTRREKNIKECSVAVG